MRAQTEQGSRQPKRYSIENDLSDAGTKLNAAIQTFNEKRKEAFAVLEAAREAYNSAVRDAFAEVTTAQEAYNETITAANDLREEVLSEMNDYFDSRSETWQDGDSGSAFADWRTDWEVSFEDLDLDEPDELEMDEPDEIEEIDVATFENHPEERA